MLKHSLLEIRQYNNYFYIAYAGELNKELNKLLHAGRQVRTYNNFDEVLQALDLAENIVNK